MKKVISFNELQIKCLLTIIMVLNHLEEIKGLLPDTVCTVFNIISRGVAPAFAYFAVEGIIHTRNLKKYNLRLFMAALIMEIGNRMLNFYFITHAVNGVELGFLFSNHPRLFSNYGIGSVDRNFLIVNDIFLTLFFLVFGISLVIWSREHRQIRKLLMRVLAVVCWYMAFRYCEWGVVLTPFLICTYFFRNNKKSFVCHMFWLN